MQERDLPRVESWINEPHVALWWAPNLAADGTQPSVQEGDLEPAGSGRASPGAHIAQYLRHIRGEDAATVMLIVEEEGAPLGWCEWYRWADYPAEAAAVEAIAGETGIDYAIGEPTMIGVGVGTRLVGALVEEVRRHVPGAGVLATPEAANVASRRVLEKNGFALVAVRPVATEPTDSPVAIYRLPPSAG